MWNWSNENCHYDSKKLRCVNYANKNKKCKFIRKFTLWRLFEKLTTSQIFFHDIVKFNNLFFLRRWIALNEILKIDFVTLTRAWRQKYEMKSRIFKKKKFRFSTFIFEIQNFMLTKMRKINEIFFDLFNFFRIQIHFFWICVLTLIYQIENSIFYFYVDLFWREIKFHFKKQICKRFVFELSASIVFLQNSFSSHFCFFSSQCCCSRNSRWLRNLQKSWRHSFFNWFRF